MSPYSIRRMAFHNREQKVRKSLAFALDPLSGSSAADTTHSIGRRGITLDTESSIRSMLSGFDQTAFTRTSCSKS